MTLQYLTPAQAENTLGALYVEETGPTLSFLVGLLSQPHYRAWSLRYRRNQAKIPKSDYWRNDYRQSFPYTCWTPRPEASREQAQQNAR